MSEQEKKASEDPSKNPGSLTESQYNRILDAVDWIRREIDTIDESITVLAAAQPDENTSAIEIGALTMLLGMHEATGHEVRQVFSEATRERRDVSRGKKTLKERLAEISGRSKP